MKNFKIATLLAVIFTMGLVAGCEGTITEKAILDQCMRQKLFEKCMASLPAGPNETVYNDWAEVVDECHDVASYNSYRMKANIKPECRASN